MHKNREECKSEYEKEVMAAAKKREEKL